MSAKLLLIADPRRYPDADGDVPGFYRAAARHPELTALHLATEQINSCPPAQWQLTRLPQDLDHGAFLALGHAPLVPFTPAEIDVAFCRSLKPFGEGYLQVLQGLEPQLRFLNRPSSKIQQLKPHFLSELAGAFMPAHLVSGDPDEIASFLESHGEVVAKQGNSTQAQGVFRLSNQQGRIVVEHALGQRLEHPSFGAALEQLQGGPDTPLQFMRFLPRTSEGDKRVVVLDGQILGAYVRRSATGHWVNNVAAGGRCALAPVTDAERQAIASTWPAYASMGLRVLGYDFLQDDSGTWRVSEINVGNVGGFARLQQLGGGAALDQLLAWIHDFALAPALLEIRAAQARDDGAIAAIYQRAIDQGGITMDACRFPPKAVAKKREELGERGCLLVGTRLGEVLGWAELKPYSDRAGYSRCGETSVYVHPSAQGQGLGAQLLQQLIAKAADHGYGHLVAKVVAGNDHSIRFHQRFGYETVGLQRRIGYLHGRWYDVMILQRLLQAEPEVPHGT